MSTGSLCHTKYSVFSPNLQSIALLVLEYGNLFHQEILKNVDLIGAWDKKRKKSFFELLNHTELMKISTLHHFRKGFPWSQTPKTIFFKKICFI